MRHRIPPLVSLNSDDAEIVQRKVLEHFKTTSFTSYTEILPEGSMIVLRLQKKAIHTGTVQFSLMLVFYCEVKCVSFPWYILLYESSQFQKQHWKQLSLIRPMTLI